MKTKFCINLTRVAWYGGVRRLYDGRETPATHSKDTRNTQQHKVLTICLNDAEDAEFDATVRQQKERLLMEHSTLRAIK